MSFSTLNAVYRNISIEFGDKVQITGTILSVRNCMIDESFSYQRTNRSLSFRVYLFCIASFQYKCIALLT